MPVRDDVSDPRSAGEEDDIEADEVEEEEAAEVMEIEEDEEESDDDVEEEEIEGDEEPDEEVEEVEETAEVDGEVEGQEEARVEGNEEYGGGTDSPSDFPEADYNKDTNHKIESEGLDEDLKLISSIPDKSEIKSTSAHAGGARCGSFTVVSHSSQFQAGHPEASCLIDRNSKRDILDKPLVSSKENGCQESFISHKNTDFLLRKEASEESPIDVKTDHDQIHGDHSSLLTSKDSVDAENCKSLYFNEKELVLETMTKKGSGSCDPDVSLHLRKEVLHYLMQADLKATDLEPSSSSFCSPHQRPRSPSVGALENDNKRPTIICDFFARGWCIKGNSCRFLHLKDKIDDTSKEIKENLARSHLKRDFEDETGLKNEVAKSSASYESSASSSAGNTASKSHFLLQRALVRAYGGERHGLHQLNDEHRLPNNSNLFPDKCNMHTSPYVGGNISGSGMPSDPSLNECQQKSFVSSQCQRPHFNTMDDGRPNTGDFVSRKHLIMEEMNHEKAKIEYLSDGPFSRGSPVRKNSLPLEYRNHSSSSSIYQSARNHAAYDASTADPIMLKQGPFSFHDSDTSFSSLNSSFTNSLHHVSPSINTFAQPVPSSTRGSTALSAEHHDTYEISDYERGFYSSRSVSLPQSSSPYSGPEPEIMLLHTKAEGVLATSGSKTQFQGNAWEPSIPFRSSFYCPPASISSPGNQYDPLLDSIDPPKTTLQGISSHRANDNPSLSGSCSPGFLGSFPNFEVATMSKSKSGHEIGGFTSAEAAAHVTPTIDGLNKSSTLKEKSWSPDHTVDIGNAKEIELHNNPRNLEDRGRHNKELKALKIFRAALVEFVKELVKPSWKEGHLSKDTHKMIVKKAVDKVLSAIQSYQIPSTTESVNQYLSSSRLKILKLVEGYVEKYAKS